MKKQNLFFRVAFVLLAFFSTQQLAYAQPCSNPINLISNGDFSSGFTGFTSGLALTTTNTCQIDRYGIGTAFDDFCISFPTTPSGPDMMVVDLHNSPANTMILQQAISGVTAGTNYTIGFRGASRHGGHPVPIDIYYDGTFINTITINTPHAFGNYSINWTAPGSVASSGNVTFRIGGFDIWYDFALTDIEFSYCPSTSWRNTYQNDKDHNHFSVVELKEDFVVAGTLYEHGELTNTTFGVRRFNNTGTIVWEKEYFLDDVDDARCFDIATTGTDDDATLALTGYVVSSGSQVPRPFVMTLKAADGSIIDYKEFILDAFDQATGLDILYSATKESYYVAGYQADDILDLNSNKAGFVMSLDLGLNINWTNFIFSPANSSTRNMANNLTELPGTGIFVTGSVNNNSTGGGAVSTLKVLLDYSGSTIWDLTTLSTNSHECGVDAVYDPVDDLLYVMSNNSVVHTFEIQRIDNASSAGANISTARSNNLLSVLNSNVEGFSLAFDPNSAENLIVAGMIRSMPGATVNTPTFIATVDINNFSVSALHYIEAHNAGYRDHDHDMFQAFYGQQAVINYPDILGVFPSNFVILGYEGLNAGYNLSVTYTDANGQTPSSKDCEVTVSANSFNMNYAHTGAEVKDEGGHDENLGAYEKELEYKVYLDCEPLEFSEGKSGNGHGVSGIASTSDKLQVYPNPASATLQIKLPNTGDAMQVSVRLIDALGRVVMENNNTYASGAIAQFNVSDIPEGIYFLSVQAGNYKTQEPIVIAH